MDTLERTGRWFLEKLTYEMFIIAVGLAAICIFVQIGIHKGRQLERAEIEALVSVYEETP